MRKKDEKSESSSIEKKLLQLLVKNQIYSSNLIIELLKQDIVFYEEK